MNRCRSNAFLTASATRRPAVWSSRDLQIRPDNTAHSRGTCVVYEALTSMGKDVAHWQKNQQRAFRATKAGAHFELAL
jgi:hypothetical protein